MMPEAASQEGTDRRDAAFCYPAELAHGFFHSLLEKSPPPDVIFLPHFKSVPVSNGQRNALVCPIVQGETFFLQATFRQDIAALKRRYGTKLITPLIDFSSGWPHVGQVLIDTALQLGIGKRFAQRAFEKAFVLQKLAEYDNNISQTAEAIGIERSHLYKKIKAFDISL